MIDAPRVLENRREQVSKIGKMLNSVGREITELQIKS